MYRFLTMCLSGLILAACSDNVPTTTPALVSNAQSKANQLQLDIPDLLGWGNIPEIKMMLGESVELRTVLKDNTNKGIPNQALLLKSKQGNFLTENHLLTDHKGQAISVLFATVVGQDHVTVTYEPELSATLVISVRDPKQLAAEPPPVIPELPGVVSWHTLEQVALVNETPQFNQSIEALHGHVIKVQGFMFPLDKARKQQHFLLSPFPPTCFFCLPAGADKLIEVIHPQGIPFTPDRLLVEGTFKVLKDDIMGLFYRLHDARVISRNG